MKERQPQCTGNSNSWQPSAGLYLIYSILALFIFSLSCYVTIIYRDSEAAKQAKRLSSQSVPAKPVPPVEQEGEADVLNPQMPLTVLKKRVDRVPFVIAEGGIAGTRRSPLRLDVQSFVNSAGARAGLNGTFFANASLSGTDNLLIGPSLCGNESTATLSPFDKKEELRGRPMVLISPTRTRIVPYMPETMDDEADLKSKVPDLTDFFVGGVWLVHHNKAATKDEIDNYKVHDAEDLRRRAFFVISQDGSPGLGATTYVTSSSKLAEALADAGIREAVLLDSGFSTSLVVDGKILVTGHTSPGIPSRPVPHAIVLFDINNKPQQFTSINKSKMPNQGLNTI